MITSAAFRLDNLFLLGAFEPASVQREYQWTTKECGQLLDDLVEAFVRAGFDPPTPKPAIDAAPGHESDPGDDGESPGAKSAPSAPLTLHPRRQSPRKREYPKDYFLGPMVLLPAPRSPGKFSVYDGLQRFTTLSILLSVLRDAFGGGDIENWFELQQLLRTEEGVARLKAPTVGATLSTITGSLGGSRPPWRRGGLAEADIRMRDAANLFHERTDDWSDARRLAFVKFLREHAYFAVMTVDDRSMAYKIFVTANDRGLSLKVGDIIKGRLVDIAAETNGPAAGENVSQKWSQLQRSLRPRFDAFLGAVDFLESGEYRPEGFGEALLERFEAPEAAARVSAWVSEELPMQAERFLTQFKYDHFDTIEGIHISFRQLDFLQDNSWRPVAMALQWAHGGDYPIWAGALRKLVRACYVLELLDWSSKRRAEDSFAPAIDQIARQEDPFAHRTKSGAYGALHFSPKLQTRARAALDSPFTDAARRGALVHFLETLFWTRSLPQEPVQRTTVEHVLPRAATGAWLKLFDENIRDSATHKLGNLCLTTKEVNYEAANLEFAAKCAAYRKLPETFRSAHEVAAYAEWTPAIVEARTAALALKVEKALWIHEPPR